MNHGPFVLVVISALVVATAPAAAGAKEKVLFDLHSKDGYSAFGTPVLDSSGNLYGTAFLGGKHGGGTVFELSPTKTGKWSIQVLHDFAKPYQFNSPKDGDQPSGALIFDASGNLYGTTFRGGKYANGTTGGGIAYRLSPRKDGTWRETVLHYFGSSTDAAEPNGGVIMDANGNFYGATELGGSYSGNCTTIGCGSVFELSPDGKGGWTETILYAFLGGTDGRIPYGGVVADASGNLYGTTQYGGANGDGIVFELSPGQNGQWTESILYSFCAQKNCADGAFPFDTPTLDAAGNIYGTTDAGGTANDCAFGSSCGAVFELSRTNGGWTVTVLHSFDISEGEGPAASVVFDTAGNLYGTTYFGASTTCNMGCGSVYELSPAQNGTWTETTLHMFENGKDGANPYGGVVTDATGNVYGATSDGHGTACGGTGCGAVYSIRP